MSLVTCEGCGERFNNSMPGTGLVGDNYGQYEFCESCWPTAQSHDFLPQTGVLSPVKRGSILTKPIP